MGDNPFESGGPDPALTTGHTTEIAPPFDLGVAIRTAGQAFYAYGRPTKGVRYKDLSQDILTQYCDTDTLQKSFLCHLHITVESARNLRITDANRFTSNPYVELWTGSSFGCTRQISSTRNPEWYDGSFKFWVSRQSSDPELHIVVKDTNLAENEDLGHLRLKIKGFTEGENRLDHEKLLGKGASIGDINLVITKTSTGARTPGDDPPTEATLRMLEEVSHPACDFPCPSSVAFNRVAPSAVDAAAMVTAWTSLSDILEPGSHTKAHTVAFIQNANTDTQAVISYREATLTTRKQVTIAFRGPSTRSEWLTNRRASLAPLEQTKPTQTKVTARALMESMQALRNPDQAVHTGFLQAWCSVRQRVLSVLEVITEGDASWEVMVTGHSLGGALATICAYDISKNTPTKYCVRLYTFGSPRVGNTAFASKVDELVVDSWRIQNDTDPVPNVPASLGYTHVENAVVLWKSGHLVMDDYATRLAMLECGFVQLPGEANVLPSVLVANEELERVRDKHRKGVMNVFQSVMPLLGARSIFADGTHDHQQPEYLWTLCSVIEQSCNSPDVHAAVSAIKQMVKDSMMNALNQLAQPM